MRALLLLTGFFSALALSQTATDDSISQTFMPFEVAPGIYFGTGVHDTAAVEPISFTPIMAVPVYYPPVVPPNKWTWIIAAPCGDSFHENGRLSSRAECVDGVLQGKVIFWDEKGHKTQEGTYTEGHCVKTKRYDEDGHISSVWYYDYEENLHGLCLDYDNERGYRAESRWDHGVQQGVHRITCHGVLSEETTYNQGKIMEKKNFNESGVLIESVIYGTYRAELEHKKFSDEGVLISHQWSTETGDSAFHKTWNEAGEFIAGGYLRHGYRVGTWLTLSVPELKTKHFSYYNDSGRLLRKIEMKDTLLMREVLFDHGRESDTRWDEKGDPVSCTVRPPQTGLYTTTCWKNGALTDHYTIYWPGYGYQKTFYENGFYTLNDTVYSMIVDRNNRSLPHVCYVIFKGDTLREDYVHNNAGDLNKAPSIIASNHYIYDNIAKEWVRNGQWKSYISNHLVSVRNYEMGVRKGWELYCSEGYCVSNVNEEGYYENGKQGEWTTYTDNGERTVSTYVNSLLNGEFRAYDANGT